MSKFLCKLFTYFYKKKLIKYLDDLITYYENSIKKLCIDTGNNKDTTNIYSVIEAVKKDSDRYFWTLSLLKSMKSYVTRKGT